MLLLSPTSLVNNWQKEAARFTPDLSLMVHQGIDRGGLILDEAQNVKDPENKQSRAARSIRAEYRIALTGTPVENHVGDLWSIILVHHGISEPGLPRIAGGI